MIPGLYATLDLDDANHPRYLELLSRRDLISSFLRSLWPKCASSAKNTWLRNLESRFLVTLAALEVHAPMKEDWPLIANLVERYSDFPLGGTDASVAVFAERLGTDLIVTLERRHFGALRMSDGRSFTLLPN